jgi:hypothetical protein
MISSPKRMHMSWLLGLTALCLTVSTVHGQGRSARMRQGMMVGQLSRNPSMMNRPMPQNRSMIMVRQMPQNQSATGRAMSVSRRRQFASSPFTGSPFGTTPFQRGGINPFLLDQILTNQLGFSPLFSNPFVSNRFFGTPFGFNPFFASPFGFSSFLGSSIGSNPFLTSPFGFSPFLGSSFGFDPFFGL